MVSGFPSRRLSGSVEIPASLDSAFTPQQPLVLEFASPTWWLRSWCSILTVRPPHGILVQADSPISGDDSYHIYRSSVCSFFDGFIGSLSTDAQRGHRPCVCVLDAPTTLRQQLRRPCHHGLICLVHLSFQDLYAIWSSSKDHYVIWLL
jgi:hypothetical protein